MRIEFDHANDSPRSGNAKQATPVVWAVIILALVALTMWLTAHA